MPAIEMVVVGGTMYGCMYKYTQHATAYRVKQLLSLIVRESPNLSPDVFNHDELVDPSANRPRCRVDLLQRDQVLIEVLSLEHHDDLRPARRGVHSGGAAVAMDLPAIVHTLTRVRHRQGGLAVGLDQRNLSQPGVLLRWLSIPHVVKVERRESEWCCSRCSSCSG